jgi:inhibitor of cysteine peptidase
MSVPHFINRTQRVMNALQPSKVITVPVGNPFEISLPANATTGYQWTVTPSPGLTIINQTYKVNCAPSMVGCGGEMIWTINANNQGTYSFMGIYKRPWESTPIQTTNITINVV